MAFNWGNAATGTAAGGIIPGLISGFMPGYENPAEDANKYLNRIPGEAGKYYDPYIKQGQGVDPYLEEQYRKMFSNPGDILKNISAGYQESPGYQFRKDEGLNAINNAQAASGMVGSQEHQQKAGDLAGKLATEDYEKYLNNALGIYGGGQQGLQGISNRGYNASNSMGDLIANLLSSQAQYAYAGRAGQNAANSQDKSNFFGGLGALTSGIGKAFSGGM